MNTVGENKIGAPKRKKYFCTIKLLFYLFLIFYYNLKTFFNAPYKVIALNPFHS